MSGELFHLALAALEGGIDLAVLAALVALLAVHRESIRAHWRRGLVVGGMVLLLAVPQHLTTLLYLEPERLMGGSALFDSPSLKHVAHGATFAGVVLGAVLGTAIRMLWYTAVCCVAVEEWRRLRPSWPLLGDALVARCRPMGLALALGLAAGAISTLVFHLQAVDAGRALQQLAEYFPGLAEASPGMRVLVALPLGVYAALVEELVFRGALLGFLLRVGRERRWVVAAALVLTSITWALLHLSVTDAPGLKLLQIFLVGLGLAAITRKWGLEAAILAHLGLNLAGLAGMLVLGG